MSDRLVIPNDHKFLLAEFERIHPKLIDRGKDVLIIKFLNKLSIAGKHSYEEMRDETIKYAKRLDERLLGQGPLDGTTADILTGAKIGVNLFAGNPLVTVAASVASEAMEFSFVQNWNSDGKALSAAKASRYVVEQGRLLSDALQTLHETCINGDAMCARAAADLFPDAARKAEPEGWSVLAVAPADIVEFLEDDVILANTQPQLKAAKRLADGGLEMDLKELRTALTGDFQTLTAGVREASAGIRAELDVMAAQQETVISWVKAQRAAEEKRQQAERDLQRRRNVINATAPVIQDARTGLGVVVALMSVADPKLAKQIETIGGAVINVAETGVHLVQTAINISRGLDAVLSVGTAAATGNFIAAAGALIGLFMSTGPSPEEMILEEIQALREDMRNFQKDVNERFNRIDESLDRIYTDVMKQIDKINVKLGKIDGNIELILMILAEHSQALERIDRNLSDYFQAAGRSELQATMDAALLRPSRSSVPHMSADDYQKYEGAFYTWAVTTSRSPIEAPVSMGPLDDVSLHSYLSDELELSDNFARIIQELRGRKWLPDSTDNSRLPNPRTWVLSAAAFSQLESEWPALAVRFNDKNLNGRRNQVRAGGEQLSAILQSIANRPTSGAPSAIDLACDALESRSKELAASFESEADSWEAEQRYVATQENKPYLPIWRPVGPEPGFPFLPRVKSEIPVEVPQWVVERIPELYRAVAFLIPNEQSLIAAAEFTDTIAKTVSLPGPVNGKPRTIKVHLSTARLIVRYREHPLLVFVLGEIPFQKATPAAEVAQHVQLPAWWLTHFKVPKGATDVASPEAAEAARRDLFAGCAAACNKSLFPVLANCCLDRTQRGGRLWEAASNYGGVRLLLIALFSLAMPADRKGNDWLRALFDGSPDSSGGIALPSVTQIVSVLKSGSLGGPQPARGDERPLESYISSIVAEPLKLVREFLRNRRDGADPALAHPDLAEAMLRLEVSQEIVRADYELSKTDPS